MFGIVASESIRVGGDRLDEAIAQYVKRRNNLLIGERTAEEVKIAIGSALPTDPDRTIGVRGRDQITGLPRTIELRSSDVTAALQDALAAVVQTVRVVLERTPPDLASDVIDRGIVLTGGGALLPHLDDLLLYETGVPVHIADDPLECVAKGGRGRARLHGGRRPRPPDARGVARRGADVGAAASRPSPAPSGMTGVRAARP